MYVDSRHASRALMPKAQTLTSASQASLALGHVAPIDNIVSYQI